MAIFTRGSDVAAMMLLYKEMAMEMAEDLSKIARAADEGVAVDAEWVFQQYERKASGPTIFEDVLIRQGRTTVEECANNSIKDLFIKDVLRAIKDGGKIE